MQTDSEMILPVFSPILNPFRVLGRLSQKNSFFDLFDLVPVQGLKFVELIDSEEKPGHKGLSQLVLRKIAEFL